MSSIQAITMQAIEFNGAGGSEVIQLTKRLRPEPQANEVLIKVAAAGVNRADIAQRQGIYPPPAGTSDIPGLEIAGQIVMLGKNAQRYQIGNTVCALIAGGGYSEYVVVDESNLLPIPKTLTLTEAAAIPETFSTVWTNLFQDGQLKAQDRILIHGGTSGIGTTAIMLAKAFQVRQIITTVGSATKAQAALNLGADVAINYHQQDFVEVVKQVTDHQGVDLIADIIGGSYVNKNYQAAAPFARIIQIAAQQGKANNVELFYLMKKRLIHTGSALRARTVDEKATIIADLQRYAWPLIAQGKIKPIIYQTFPLTEASKAHQLMESSAHIGKIVLIIDANLAAQYGSY